MRSSCMRAWSTWWLNGWYPGDRLDKWYWLQHLFVKQEDPLLQHAWLLQVLHTYFCVQTREPQSCSLPALLFFSISILHNIQFNLEIIKYERFWTRTRYQPNRPAGPSRNTGLGPLCMTGSVSRTCCSCAGQSVTPRCWSSRKAFSTGRTKIHRKYTAEETLLLLQENTGLAAMKDGVLKIQSILCQKKFQSVLK